MLCPCQYCKHDTAKQNIVKYEYLLYDKRHFAPRSQKGPKFGIGWATPCHRVSSATHVCLVIRLFCPIHDRKTIQRTGIHGYHKHERAWEGGTVLGTWDIDDSVLKRLTEHLQYGTLKLWQLITEEDTVVGKGYLSWLRIGASSYQSHDTSIRLWWGINHMLSKVDKCSVRTLTIRTRK